MNIVKFVLVLSFLAFVPLLVFAQTPPPGGNPCVVGLEMILCRITILLGNVIPVLVALGIVYFVWGVVQYVIASNEEAKKSGKERIVFGIIGLAIVVSLWGLVYVVENTFFTGGRYRAPTNVDLRKLLPSG